MIVISLVTYTDNAVFKSSTFERVVDGFKKTMLIKQFVNRADEKVLVKMPELNGRTVLDKDDILSVHSSKYSRPGLV